MKRLKLNKNKYAIVDDEDFKNLLNYRWYVVLQNRVFYAVRTEWDGVIKRNKRISMHSQITNFKFCDHIDGNGLNNRRKNLREATHQKNIFNSQRRKDNFSGFKGVGTCEKFKGRKKPWRARIRLNGKQVLLGYFETKNKASLAYKNAAKKFFKDFARWGK